MTLVPAFKATAVEEIAPLAKTARLAFASQKTKSLEWRRTQLRKLYWSIKDHAEALVEACSKDLGKSRYETFLTEIDWTLNDCVFSQNNLGLWMKDETPSDVPLSHKFVSPKIRKDPLGCVLVIGAFNYPVQLLLGPVIGAIAAGCTVVAKPSEQAPATAMVLGEIISRLDSDAYTTVQGAIPETTELLNQKWDKIFYTGSGNVGKIIAMKAAETLTPVTLELGGRNPAIVTRNADLRLAARRLLWAKFHNVGQVCVSQNYILVDKEVMPSFVEELKKAKAEYYPNGAKASPDYGRIVNNRQWNRLKSMIDNSEGKIVMGGTMDEADLFLEPTVVEVNSTQDSLIKDESFGPIIPLFPVDNLDQAIRIANEVDETPLGLYPFGNKSETDRVLRELRSGGATINDAFYHASIPTVSFGGIGSSGTGAYRGRASFECFTHRRSIAKTPGWLEGILAIRYPPYTGKLERLQFMSNARPNFDRNGNTTSLLSWILTLGAGSASGGAARYVLVLLAIAAVKKALDARAKL